MFRMVSKSRRSKMADYDEEGVSDAQKAQIVSNFLKHSPPGEFNEVFNDCRILLGNDSILKTQSSSAFSSYNKDQFTPVKVSGDRQALITEFAELPDGQFFDPKLKQKFKYDHLRKEGSDFEPTEVDSTSEPWRAAAEKLFEAYAKKHYPNGISAVYGTSSQDQITLDLCLEDHVFSPQNFWNGRWRTHWSVTFPAGGGCTAEVKGVFKVHVHYYEDGNVQTVCLKDIKESVKITDEERTAKELMRVVENSENEFQFGINEANRTMSDTTFKALRRALPVTRNKIDWNKILSYKIAPQLRNK